MALDSEPAYCDRAFLQVGWEGGQVPGACVLKAALPGQARYWMCCLGLWFSHLFQGGIGPCLGSELLCGPKREALPVGARMGYCGAGHCKGQCIWSPWAGSGCGFWI